MGRHAFITRLVATLTVLAHLVFVVPAACACAPKPKPQAGGHAACCCAGDAAKAATMSCHSQPAPQPGAGSECRGAHACHDAELVAAVAAPDLCAVVLALPPLGDEIPAPAPVVDVDAPGTGPPPGAPIGLLLASTSVLRI